MAKSDVITRKDMKEPDKFQQAATQAASWIAARRRRVVAAGAAAVGALLLVAILSAVRTGREERAGAAAADLLSTMAGDISPVPLPGAPGPFFADEAGRQRAVAEAAEKVIAAHEGTGAARLALLALGDARFKLREWDAARSAYDRFLSAAPKDDSLRFGALEGIALSLEEKGDLGGAAQAYERLGREVPAFADRADLERARLLAREGKTAEARELLGGFSDRHKQSLLAPEASERLARLGGG
jgi:tetratricopeptide (TPR) repeat protein